jgi:hypothetical protein
MKAKVTDIESSTTIRIDPVWRFHGFTGRSVRIVGLRPAPKGERQPAVEALTSLLLNKEIRIAEKWYVHSNTLNGLVHLENHNVADHFPDRRTFLVDPSRRFDPADNVRLARVSGGLPPMWENPLPRLLAAHRPFLDDVYYPTKSWLPTYDAQMALVDSLYVAERPNREDAGRRFQRFFSQQGPAALLIFGQCGVGKSWYATHVLTKFRPRESHFAAIDLRSHPLGQDLVTVINRELGEFLDNNINNNPDIDTLVALQHYLLPIIRPICGPNPDLTALNVREVAQDAYLKLASDPARLPEYNDRRLGYYDHSGTPLYILVDNVDTYPPEEHLRVFDFITKALLGHPGVKIIIPIRPSSKVLIERLRHCMNFISLGLTLSSPDLRTLLTRRLSTNHRGQALDIQATVPGAELSLGTLLNSYLTSAGATILRDLSLTDDETPATDPTSPHASAYDKYDCRHYIRLFRRVILSDVIMSLKNILHPYYVVHALMLRPGEPLNAGTSFLYNLFDNEDPDAPGNALARYRVLEYFVEGNTEYGVLFDEYFTALGPRPRVARRIVDSFLGAGLLRAETRLENNTETIVRVHIATAGRRHFEIVRNLWYGICIKTGMYVEQDMIKKGPEAREEAAQYVDSEKILDFYSHHGWVADQDFVRFLWAQQMLEAKRIGAYQESAAEMVRPIAGLLENLTSPGCILDEAYGNQRYNILRKKRR